MPSGSGNIETPDREYLEWIKLLHRMPVVTFFISFALGTLILVLYMANENEQVLIAGFFYVLFAFLINFVVGLVMIAIAFTHRKYQKTLLQNTCLMLLNIPITILYIMILFNN